MLLLVPNVKRFSPSGVQPFATIDPGALNTNFNNVASAFVLTPSTVSGDTQLTATLRDVVVDASTNGVQITLPVNPAVGDPPCTVGLLGTLYGSLGTPVTNCTITTSDGTAVAGIRPSGTSNNLSLLSAGDFLSLRFVGGAIGWLPRGSIGCGVFNTPPVRGAVPWQGQQLMVKTTPGALALGVEGLQVAGAMASICRFAGVNSISVGDSTSTFNGTPGPYVISASNVFYRFTCLGGRAFEVSP